MFDTSIVHWNLNGHLFSIRRSKLNLRCGEFICAPKSRIWTYSWMLKLQSAVYLLQSSLLSLLSPCFPKFNVLEARVDFENKRLKHLQMADTGQLKKGGASVICPQGAHSRPVLTGLLLQAEWFVCFQCPLTEVAAQCKVWSALYTQIIETYLLGHVPSFSFSCWLHLSMEFQFPTCLFLYLLSSSAFFIADPFYSDKRIPIILVELLSGIFTWRKGALCCFVLALFPSIIKKKIMFLVVLPKYLGEFEKKMDFELEVTW